MPSVDVKQAATISRGYIRDLNPFINPQDITVEEAELSDDETFWLITVGYPADTLRRSYTYKTFKINANTAEVHSMKFREL